MKDINILKQAADSKSMKAVHHVGVWEPRASFRHSAMVSTPVWPLWVKMDLIASVIRFSSQAETWVTLCAGKSLTWSCSTTNFWEPIWYRSGAYRVRTWLSEKLKAPRKYLWPWSCAALVLYWKFLFYIIMYNFLTVFCHGAEPQISQ